MRKADIIPGLAVAVPAGQVTTTTVKQGVMAVPAVVLGVGHYRLASQGACSNIIAPALSQNGREKVAVLRKSGNFYNYWSGYSRASDVDLPDFINSNTEWSLAIVDPSSIIPWEHYQVIHGEYMLAVDDVAAARADMERLKNQMHATIKADPVVAGLPGDPRVSFPWADEIGVEFRLEITKLSTETRDALAKLKVAYSAASKRTECQL